MSDVRQGLQAESPPCQTLHYKSRLEYESPDGGDSEPLHAFVAYAELVASTHCENPGRLLFAHNTADETVATSVQTPHQAPPRRSKPVRERGSGGDPARDADEALGWRCTEENEEPRKGSRRVAQAWDASNTETRVLAPHAAGEDV